MIDCKKIVGWSGCPSLIAFIIAISVVIWIIFNG